MDVVISLSGSGYAIDEKDNGSKTAGLEVFRMSNREIPNDR